MKKSVLTCFCLLGTLFSCTESEYLNLPDGTEKTLSTELENVVNAYEASLKGYEDYSQVKDESTPSTEKEVFAEDWIIETVKDSILNSPNFSYSKTRTDATQVLALGPVKVGVFKYSTCGNNREFVYFMDCEDGGWTKTIGDVGATYADGNNNMEFRFCLVDPADYGGGVLLLTTYGWISSHGEVDVVVRYHDNEDTRNENQVKDNGGLYGTGESSFTENTSFVWRFADKKASLPFSYGVIANEFDGVSLTRQLSIDDQNRGNSNFARVFRHHPVQGTTVRDLGKGESFRGIYHTENTIYDLKFY